MFKGLIMLFASFMVSSAFADIRDSAVLQSPVIKRTLQGLNQEQGLVCKIYKDENGELSINYFVSEDNIKKFSAGFLCNDGRTAIFVGKLDGSGATAVEFFELMYAN